MKRLFLIFLSQIIFAMGAEAQIDSRRASRPSTSDPTQEKSFVDVDLGASAGSSNGQSFSEINLGVNLNFTEWLTWRNSAFKRFSSARNQDFAGLDSTVRLISTTEFDTGVFRMFGGAGYRFASPSEKNAMVAEAGLGLSLGGFGIGGGAKYLRYDKAQVDSSGFTAKRDDLIYFITLAGGSSFGF